MEVINVVIVIALADAGRGCSGHLKRTPRGLPKARRGLRHGESNEIRCRLLAGRSIVE